MMFKFNFEVEDNETPFGKTASNYLTRKTSESITEWYSAAEIKVDNSNLDNLDLYKLNATELTIDNVCINFIISGCLMQDVAINDDLKDIGKAESSHTDLIPGVYEGGAKIWECTEDLLQYLSKNFVKNDWQNKLVLDLGCGAGLLGIYAYKLGSKVHFQDYNKEVLEKVTIPNVLLNVPDVENVDLKTLGESVKFFSGDWSKYSEYTKDHAKFDIILTSETIYNSGNHIKLLNTLKEKLSLDGVVLIAAKTYYFGVGGGLRQFEELILNDKHFQLKKMWASIDGVGREILALNH